MASLFRAVLHTKVTPCARDMVSTHVLRFRAAHKAVSKICIIDSMLREKVPAEVFVVFGTSFRRIWTGMSDVPYMTRESMLSHCFTDSSIARAVHGWHEIAIELAN